jgi:ribosomal protein S4
LKHGDSLDKVLGLSLKNLLDRRLQAFMLRKSYARTMKQARQFITHGHVLVDKKKVTFPSYFVTLKEESLIEFMPKSGLSREDHPERVQIDKDAASKAKSAADKKKKKDAEELPSFSETEIVKIEETGAVESAVVVESAK